MCPNPQETAYLVTFTEEIFIGKLHFLYSATHTICTQPCADHVYQNDNILFINNFC